MSEAIKVLCVDDNADVANSTGELLSLSGFTVQVHHDGASALAAARAFAPTVCVIDLNMPGMDGFELAARITAEAGANPPRLVAQTAMWDIQTQHKTRNAGFVAHLVKPVEPKRLLEIVTGAPA